MQLIALEDLSQSGFFNMPIAQVQARLKELDVPLFEKAVNKHLFTVAWAVPPKIDWKKSALLNDLSPSSGIGAAAYCIRNQMKNSIRIVGHIPGGRRELLLTKNNSNKQLRRVRWYANSRLKGENKSYAWFNITGFNHEDAPLFYVFMALDGDDPFWWAISTSKLIDEWERIDERGRNQKYAPDEMFRVVPRHWDNPNGSLRIRLSKSNGRFVMDTPAKVGL